jgi:hypothetical protein
VKPNLDHVADEDLCAEVTARMARPQAPAGDWLSAYESGELLLVEEAAIVAGVSVDTVRRWCAASVDVGEPIALLIAGLAWLISFARLLTTIEQRKGRDERDAAERRAKGLRSRPTNLQPCGHAGTRSHGRALT